MGAIPEPIRRLVGGLIGAAIGYAVTMLLAQVGGLLMAAIGGGFALGAGSFGVTRSMPWAIAVAAVAAGITVTHSWHSAPLPLPDGTPGGLGYFLANSGSWHPMTWVGIAIAGALGLFYGGGTRTPVPPAPRAD